MNKLLVCILFFLFCIKSSAQKTYEFNSICQQAYKELIQLKINNAEALIAKAKQQNPDNLIPVLLDNYIDFLTLIFTEDPAYYATHKESFTTRINQLKEGPQISPFYNFSIGLAYMQKAAVAMRFGEKWRAGWDMRESYLAIKDNKNTYPTFTPNNLYFGGLQTIVGTIPKSYNWVTGMFGLKGNIKEGMQTLQSFVNSNDPWAKFFFNEGAFVYAYLNNYLNNDKDDAIGFIAKRKLDVVNNHLLTYMAANLYINNKKMAEAANIIINRNQSNEYLQSPIWNYELGITKLFQLNYTEAAKQFELYVNTFKGKSFIKDAYLKLSWCYYLAGNTTAAENAKKQILTKGSNLTDADKKALKDAKLAGFPNAQLLKARLLNDGGFYNQALNMLADKNIESFTNPAEKLEYLYRMARIYDDLKNDAAISYYKRAIELGIDRKEYFASRATLQLGELFERKGNKVEALKYFEQALAMKDHDYKDSIDQKAKAGIARCKGQ